ncbi:dTDP-4-dehydrorhamnose 3,5-epimerase family protein, partial [Klebsiella quasipneumoniae]
MNIIKTEIPEVLIFEPRVFGDARGFFFESFSSKVFNEAVGRQVEFVQDNHSQSQKGVLRGLHYQLDPHAQGKLPRFPALWQRFCHFYRQDPLARRRENGLQDED